MALRFIRSKLPTRSDDPLQTAISATSMVKEILSGLAQLYGSPLTAPVSVVLLILKTVQDIQRNQAADCVALAWKATQVLVDVDLTMRGRWDSAPERMVQSLQKFEGILKHIHESVQSLSDSKGSSDRDPQENSIQSTFAGYARLIDEATQSIQVAALIDLHDSVGTLTRSNTENMENQETVPHRTDTPPPCEKEEMEDSNPHIRRVTRARL